MAQQNPVGELATELVARAVVARAAVARAAAARAAVARAAVARAVDFAVDWVADTVALHGVADPLDLVVGKVAKPQSNPMAEFATELFARVDLWVADIVALHGVVDLLDPVVGKIEVGAGAVDRVAGTGAVEMAPEVVDRVVGVEVEAVVMVVETAETVTGVVGVALDKASGLADYKVG